MSDGWEIVDPLTPEESFIDSLTTSPGGQLVDAIHPGSYPPSV